MSSELISVTLNTANLAALVEFYSFLGFPLKKASVSHGSELYRAQQGNIELCLFGLVEKKNTASPVLQLGFHVSALKDLFPWIKCVDGVTVILEPTELPGGLKAIVKDPDGNSVELIEQA